MYSSESSGIILTKKSPSLGLLYVPLIRAQKVKDKSGVGKQLIFIIKPLNLLKHENEGLKCGKKVFLEKDENSSPHTLSTLLFPRRPITNNFCFLIFFFFSTFVSN